MRDWFKNARLKAGLKQKELSERLGIAPSYCCEIESGNRQRDMSYSMMTKIAAAFDVPVQAIIDAEIEYQTKRGDAT